MSRNLSHAAYMAFVRRGSHSSQRARDARPQGELVWLHAADETRADALSHIAEKLTQQRPELTVLMTHGDNVALPSDLSADIMVDTLPDESGASVDMFLSHWRPDLCLWTGGDLRPALLSRADERGITLYLVDAEESQLDRSGWRWFPDLSRGILKRFAQIQCRSEETARMLRRLGIPAANISVTGQLRREATPLPCSEAARDRIAQSLLGRPIWLAAHLQMSELDIVLAAQRKVSRLSHRLILVICPHSDEDRDAIDASLRQRDLRVAVWSKAELPSETTQVILGGGNEDLGLWYRLAPVCLMGSSLVHGLSGSDPHEAAVLGSAILYGPNVANHLKEYTRFSDARAARIIRDAETLAAALENLIAPDQAASMAHAAWDIASQGAEMNDRVIDLIQDTLDVAGQT